MLIRVTAQWNPDVQLEEDMSVSVETLLVDTGDKFQMELDYGDEYSGYLSSIHRAWYGDIYTDGWKIVDRDSGKRTWESEVDNFYHTYHYLDYVRKEVNEQDAIERVKKFLGKYYIVTRDEHVSHKEYHTFYGSVGLSYRRLHSTYERGTHEEMFIQTIYDMEHSYKNIFGFTNAAWPLVKVLGYTIEEVPESELKDKDENIVKFYNENVTPILQKMKDNATKENLIELIETLNEIPIVKEKYNLDNLIN
jgi:hypothetical protein